MALWAQRDLSFTVKWDHIFYTGRTFLSHIAKTFPRLSTRNSALVKNGSIPEPDISNDT